MFPYSARWFDGGYSFMSVYRGLVFYITLYLAVNCTVFGVRLWSTGLWNILGDDFRYGFRVQGFLGRQWIPVLRQFKAASR